MIFDFLSELIKPITDTINNLTTTDKEKLALKNQLTRIQNLFGSKMLDYESKLADDKSKIIIAEAKGNWLQSHWRPILMLVIVAIVANNYLIYPYLTLFGIKTTSLQLPDKLWNLMTIGVGGYIAGRSAEKIVNKRK